MNIRFYSSIFLVNETTYVTGAILPVNCGYTCV